MSFLRHLVTSAVRRPSTTTSASFITLRPAARRLSTLPRLPLFEAVAQHDPESKAVIHSLSGRTFKYGELLGDVSRARDRLAEAAGHEDLNGERIAFLVENSYDYVGELMT
jgi:malonyl-CoA/methylmalonyl-CoA synthetase